MKKVLMIALAAALCIAMVGCSKSDDKQEPSAGSSSPSSSVQENADADAPGADADAVQAESPDEAEAMTFTGKLDEKKDFMIIAIDDDDNAVIFNLDEGVTCDAEVGDRIQITYTGDIEDMDAQLMAQSIVIVE